MIWHFLESLFQLIMFVYIFTHVSSVCEGDYKNSLQVLTRDVWVWPSLVFIINGEFAVDSYLLTAVTTSSPQL
ncbi:hypothetical protein CEXT_543821 [Caerostris extrusa]|uniref:Uncharacterized protein n=1 Tax=Caerostris extrusa TaxID=172846 RepID=A0AAV4XJK1_CAEEX|nr:hypothetical protein CEXT_543821 [Caerostris extrusa]